MKNDDVKTSKEEIYGNNVKKDEFSKNIKSDSKSKSVTEPANLKK
jgi:hypothetical protein